MNKTTLTLFAIIILIIAAGIYAMQSKNAETVVQEIPDNNRATTTSTNSGENTPEESTHNLPVPAAVAAARKHLAQTLKITEGKIVIMTAFEKEWPDGCLGLPKTDEMCTKAIVPGYEVTMKAQGKTYIYRTNSTGSVLRVQK